MRNVFVGTLVGAVLVAGVAADAAAPAGRYMVAAGTVYDVKTKLTWQQTIPSVTYTWMDARAYCVSAAVASALGGSGWRLPTKKELLTLVDFSVPSPGPAIDNTAFLGTPGSNFWSVTPVASMSTAWQVSFDSGATTTNATGIMANVRCVR